MFSKDTSFYGEANDLKTFIRGKQVQLNWKFISDGTWFDKGIECKLETDCGTMGGLFRGMRTCQHTSDLATIGQVYEDSELSHWCEFTIYDENGVLMQEPYYGWDGSDCMTFIWR